MLTRFPLDEIAVLGGGRVELAERLLEGNLDLTANAALVLHEPDGYYVIDYDELREVDRLWTMRSRLHTIPSEAVDVAAMIEAELDFQAAAALTVSPGDQPETRAVELTAAGVEGAWAPSSDALDTMGAEPLPQVAANGDGADAADGGIIRRTPHLDAPDQLKVAVGETFDVTVWTDTAPARDDEESDEVVIELPADVREVELGVLLRASPHFRVAGAYFGTLRVEREQPDSEPLKFSVEVINLDEPGPAAIDATLLWEGRECGNVRREWSWPGGEAKTLATRSGAVSVTTGVGRPDLSVSVRSPTNDGRQQWSVCAPDLPGFEQWTEPQDWSIRDRSSEFIAELLDRFVDRRLDDRRAELRKAGRQFWKAAAPVFHDALWALIDHREGTANERRATIYVATDDPVLPWELMLPSRDKEDGAQEDRAQPIGVEFALGRRLRGDRRPPPELLPVRDSLVIAAKYESDERKLDHTAELEVLERNYGGRLLEQASKTYFDEHLAEKGASLVHIVCHGSAHGTSETLYLDDDKAYSSGDVRDSEGFSALCAQHHPIVFINACDAGTGHLTLAPGGTGFPQAFTELGARAVIAPLWPVSKFNAPTVAVTLYTRAAAEPDRPLADILAELRATSYSGPAEDFDDSWAAYCFFGDPCAPLRRDDT